MRRIFDGKQQVDDSENPDVPTGPTAPADHRPPVDGPGLDQIEYDEAPEGHLHGAMKTLHLVQGGRTNEPPMWVGEVSGRMVVGRQLSDYARNYEYTDAIVPKEEPGRLRAAYEINWCLGQPARVAAVAIRPGNPDRPSDPGMLIEEFIPGKPGVSPERLSDSDARGIATFDAAVGNLNRNPYNVLATDDGAAIYDHGLILPTHGGYRVSASDVLEYVDKRGMLDLDTAQRRGYEKLVTHPLVADRLSTMIPNAAVEETRARVGYMLDIGRLVTPQELQDRPWDRTRDRLIGARWARR